MPGYTLHVHFDAPNDAQALAIGSVLQFNAYNYLGIPEADRPAPEVTDHNDWCEHVALTCQAPETYAHDEFFAKRVAAVECGGDLGRNGGGRRICAAHAAVTGDVCFERVQ